jgi:hypothetical protein
MNSLLGLSQIHPERTKQFSIRWLLLMMVLTCATLVVLPLIRARAARQASQTQLPGRARLAETIAVPAPDRGNPSLSLNDGHNLLVNFAGDPKLQQLLVQNQAQALSLCSADFDEDGVPDLISGYSGGGQGILTLYRGNVDAIYPNSPEAQQRRANGTFSESPFLSPALVFSLPGTPDFTGAGDFDGDSHLDVVAATRGGTMLYLLSGDGQGGFLPAKEIQLAGRVTAMTTGEVNRRDGLTDVVVGTESLRGAQVLVYEGPEGALRSQPEAFALPVAATSMALGQLDDGYEMDLTVAAGQNLLIVHGRDRMLSLDETKRAAAPPARIDDLNLAGTLRSVAVGDFSGRQQHEIAVLREDGMVQVVTLTGGDETHSLASHSKRTLMEAQNADEEAPPTQMMAARLSSNPADSLLLMEGLSHQLRVLVDERSTRTLTTAGSGGTAARQTVMDVDDVPVAMLPMRLNSSALNSLVLLRTNQTAPAIVQPATGNNYVVTTTSDNVAGSLRQALLDANANPGADTISFNIPGSGVKTLALSGSLPDVTSPVTIDGTTQPGFSGKPVIVLPGGLSISAGSTTVRGLVFSSGGLTTNGNNILEGNFVCTNADGTSAITSGGINISADSPNNTMGGTTTAARNVISCQNTAVAVHGVGNKLLGNFIGTDVTGTVAIGQPSAAFEAIFFAGQNGTLGGTTAGARNIITAISVLSPVYLDGAVGPIQGNLIQGNYIGTDVTGLNKIGQPFIDIYVLFDTVSGTIIGGTVSSARNVIAGGNAGVDVYQAKTTLIQGNFIGTDSTGTHALGNGNGVGVTQATQTTIGGDSAAARNIISGNTSYGIYLGVNINGQVGDSGTVVQNNYIGTDVTGTACLGNGLDGILVNVQSIDLVIKDNLIACNGKNGINIPNTTSDPGTPALQVSMTSNKIFGNSVTAIDLGNAGDTTNDDLDADTGANTQQNYPELQTAAASVANRDGTKIGDSPEATSITVNYRMRSSRNTTFNIEFFASNGSCVSKQFTDSRGERIGSESVTTDANGVVNRNIILPLPATVNDPKWLLASATATNVPAGTVGASNGNTSELSQCLAVSGGTSAHNKKTAGVFRPSDGIVYLRNSNTTGIADTSMVYGIAGDVPIAGDWNNDGIDTLGIYRNGTFYLRNSNTTGPADIVFAFGATGDQPLAGDWNGDGIDTVGVYRPTTGVFFLRNSNSTGPPDLSFVLGNPGDVAIAGDWNGDGIVTCGVFRPTNGIVYLKNTNVSGNADISLVYGIAGDLPLAGDWDGDGIDSIGVYRNALFYLRNSNTQGFADIVFALGNNGDVPIAGDWDGLP